MKSGKPGFFVAQLTAYQFPVTSNDLLTYRKKLYREEREKSKNAKFKSFPGSSLLHFEFCILNSPEEATMQSILRY